MAIKVGINGFGRMGRLGLRAGWGMPEGGTGIYHLIPTNYLLITMKLVILWRVILQKFIGMILA